jgi:protein gp37
VGDTSQIEWTDATSNPVTGCTKVSPGCAHCYIERTPPFRIAGRQFVRGHIPLEIHENRLDQPLRWTRSRMVFANTLSDLFHEDLDPLFVGRVFNVMGRASWHTFQVLTKRPERMLQVVRAYYAAVGTTPYPNVWLGVTAENRRWLRHRGELLAQTPAAVRFLSLEPLLEDVAGDLQAVLSIVGPRYPKSEFNWVIVGGESGPKARPCRPEWIRALRDVCESAGVPFLFKQWGGRTAKSGGRELDGRTWDEYPEVCL